MLLIRSILFQIGFVLATGFFGSTAMFLILPKTPYHWRYNWLVQWSKFVLWWLKITCNLRYEVEGLDNIPKQNAIIFSNHQSTWETIAFQQIFPPQTWVLKQELLRIPFFGWGTALLKPVAIDRKALRQSLRQIVEQGKARLQEGLWVVIFPEGTRLVVGERRPYTIGGAMLAEKSGYPILPIAHNAGVFWSRSRFIKKAGVIRIKIGAPIIAEGKNAKMLNETAETWINAELAQLPMVAER